MGARLSKQEQVEGEILITLKEGARIGGAEITPDVRIAIEERARERARMVLGAEYVETKKA